MPIAYVMERGSIMKRLSILLAVAILVTLVAVPAAIAQGITYTSGYQVQNLENATATVTIAYYNQDGTKAVNPDVSGTIPAMGSVTYFPIHASDGFNGSVVVSSDKKIVAIANTLGNNPQYAASTEGFDAGATTVMLPLIMRGNAGYFTWFNVQNVGASPATVTVNFVRGSAGNNYTAPAVTIQPYAASTFNQRDLTALGTQFVGSAIVTSNQPIVATVMQVGETYKNMMGYNGFTAGSRSVSLPLVMANNSGYYTGIQIQNVSPGVANVTIAYGANIAGGFVPTNESATLQSNESKTFIQQGGQWTGKYVGSATVTADQDIVAIVNQVKMTGTVQGTSYNGFNPVNATNKVSAPLIMANNSNYYTGFQVMNVGAGSVNITVTYGPNTGGGFAPAGETTSVAPGNSYNSIQSGGQWGANKYVGSAVVTADAGAKIVMIVNQVNPVAAGDQYMTYDGFNY